MDNLVQVVADVLKERYTNTILESGNVGVPLTGIHYSNGVRTVLSGDKYGTGIKGAEAKRLQYVTDKRILKRVYFYNQESHDTYPQREPGLGTYVHETKLTNIFDPDVATKEDYDALQPSIRRYVQDIGEDKANAFELALLDAGYNGYLSRQDGKIVVLNKDHVPTKYIGQIDELEKK